MIDKMSKHIEKVMNKNMSSEQEQKQSITNPKLKEFKSLLDEDFKERKLKENEIIKATVTK